jgi:hypothetical protein
VTTKTTTTIVRGVVHVVHQQAVFFSAAIGVFFVVCVLTIKFFKI